MKRDLPAKFRTDRAAAAGNKNCFAADKIKDLFRLHFYGFPAEQILDRHFFQIGYSHITADKLIHSRKVLQLASRFLAYCEDIPSLSHCRGRHCDIDLFDIIFAHARHDHFPAADNRDPFDIATPLIVIIVYDADYSVFKSAAAFDITNDHLSRTTSTDEHDVHPFGSPPLKTGIYPDEVVDPVEKTYSQRKNKLDNRTDDIV